MRHQVGVDADVTRTVIISILTGEETELSNFDLAMAWDKDALTLVSIENEQSGLFPNIQANAKPRDANVGRISEASSESIVTVVARQTLAVHTFTATENVERTYNFMVTYAM